MLLISSREKVVDEKIGLLNRDLQKVTERLRDAEERERLRAKGERLR